MRQSVPRPVFQTLVSALVLSRLDYGNAILYGLPDSQLNKYQAVLNAAARLILGGRSRDHVTPLLMQLHWLRIRERIAFKIACITWRCLNGCGPEYLVSDLHYESDGRQRRGLRSDSSLQLARPRTNNVSHGDRAWPAAAASVWNSLAPGDVRHESSYLSFRRDVKTFLWSHSFH